MDSGKKNFLLSRYIILIISVFLLSSLITLPFLNNTSERLFVFLTLLLSCIIIVILITYLFENYVKPVRVSIHVMKELTKGNYNARAYMTPKGEAQQLNDSINVLAKHLQERHFQEKSQSNQWDTIMNNMESGLMLLDDRGYVHIVNRKFMELFSETESDIIGYLYYDVLSDQHIHKIVQEIFLYEEKIVGRIELNQQDRYFVEVVGVPVKNEKNELKGAVLVFHDISDLKRVEEMRKDFVANVSHELKTPITSIRGFAETLLDDELADEETRKHFIQIILKESTRLQSLIYDLLELSKIEKEEMNLSIKQIQVNEWMQNNLSLIRQLLEKKSLQLHQDIQPEIVIYADPDLLQQVVLNLLHNAINYTPEGGKIYIRICQDKNGVHLQVEDTGMGIPEEAIQRIFERFYRVDRARSRHTGGTGLGLSIVKHIVEAHKGTIHVTSKVGKGSVFSVTLPQKW